MNDDSTLETAGEYVAGEDLQAGDLVYINADEKYMRFRYDSIAHMIRGVVIAPCAAGETPKIARQGVVSRNRFSDTVSLTPSLDLQQLPVGQQTVEGLALGVDIYADHLHTANQVIRIEREKLEELHANVAIANALLRRFIVSDMGREAVEKYLMPAEGLLINDHPMPDLTDNAFDASDKIRVEYRAFSSPAFYRAILPLLHTFCEGDIDSKHGGER